MAWLLCKKDNTLTCTTLCVFYFISRLNERDLNWAFVENQELVGAIQQELIGAIQQELIGAIQQELVGAIQQHL